MRVSRRRNRCIEPSAAYCAATDSFCACCFAGTGRAAAARSDAFLRRKYAKRRLRLIRTRCCCPMESLWIENPRNAISIETDRAFSTMRCGLCSPLLLRREEDSGEGLIRAQESLKDSSPSPLLAKERRRAGVLAVTPGIDEPTIEPHGSSCGRVEIVIAFR